ncbi:MAG: tetratricopeptide repeat protein [Bacteroidales bacterium]|nr:tetratricopeptide repeat protein [Bacteroidales bacterium]
MKTKSLIFIALTAFLCTFANAQVRQIFKVIDYSTRKPLAGATFECCGQKLTTNAKGVAVFTSQKHKYGDYCETGYIKAEGYVSIGPRWKNRKSDLLCKDTIVYYMADAKEYFDERYRLFDSLFMFKYRNEFVPSLEQASYMLYFGTDADELCNQLKGQEYLSETRELYYTTACNVHPINMYYIDKEIRRPCEEYLLRGDAENCLQTAKNQIVDGDNSDNNLQRIDYYLTLRDATNDTTHVSHYYKILYNNGFRSDDFIYNYYFELENEGKTDEAEQLKQTELAKTKSPYLKLKLGQNPFKIYSKDPENPNAEAAIKLCLDNIEATRSVEQNLFRINNMNYYYRCASYIYLWEENEQQAEQYLDSAFNTILKLDKKDFSNELSYKRGILNRLSVLPCFNGFESPTSDKIKDYALRLTKEILDEKPSLCNRLLYLYLMQRRVAGNDSLMLTYLPAMDSVEQSLKDDLPYIMLPGIFRTKANTTFAALFSDDTPGEILRNFDEYKKAYYACRELFPGIFESNCLYNNFNIKKSGYKTGNDFIAEPADALSEEILTAEAKKDGTDSLLMKGAFYNSDAESLYREELYQQSMKSYNKAAGYYTRAAANDTSGFAYIKLCDNLLQKGDAYFNLKRYDDAIACYQQVFDYEKQIPQPAKPRYTAQKGQAYHFEGDMMLAQKEFKKANKLFDKAEKEFKKAEKMGDSTLYGHWAELHFSKAILNLQQEKEDKMIEELEIAERLYQTKPMGNASRKYETVKNTLLKRYKENKDWNKYLVCKSTFHQYLDTVKYTDFEHYEEYVNSAIELGDLWANIGLPTAVLRYYKEAKAGKEFLMGYGQDPDDEYYKLAYQVGRYYRICDSTQQAIEQFAECEKINLMMYADTAPETAMFNDLNIKSQTAQSYEDLAQSDTVEGENWYKEAIPLYTLIVNKLSTMDTNPSLKRNLGYYHRRLANVHLNLNHYYSADKHFDTALAVMLPLYNGEFKEYTEEEVARDYLGKAIIYRSNEDYEDFSKAKEMLTACIKTCQKATDPDELLNIQYYAVSMLLDILEDPTQHASETDIKNYRKQKAELEKKLEKQN